MEDMAFRYPITMEELTDIIGVGAGFGAIVLLMAILGATGIIQLKSVNTGYAVNVNNEEQAGRIFQAVEGALQLTNGQLLVIDADEEKSSQLESLMDSLTHLAPD